MHRVSGTEVKELQEQAMGMFEGKPACVAAVLVQQQSMFFTGD